MLQKLNNIEKNWTFLAYVYATVGNFTLVLMQIFMRMVSRTMPTLYTLFLRGILLLVVNTIVVRTSHMKVDQTNKQIHSLLMKRTIFSSSALTSFMSTIPFIPIGIANSLFNMGPLFIYFVEAFYHKHPLNKTHFILTVICFAGVLFIIKPPFLFGDISSWPIIFMILPVIGAFCNSFSMLFLHELKGRVSNLIALQYFYIGQTFLTATLQNFQQFKLKQQINLSFFLYLFGLVFFAYMTQNLVTRAIYIKKASYIMPFGYISIVIAFICDIVFFEANFDWLSIMGMIMTSAGLFSKLVIKEDQNSNK